MRGFGASMFKRLKKVLPGGGGGAPALPPDLGAPMLGQVATNSRCPTASSTSNKQFMSRSPHFARDAISSLKVVLANWYWDRANTQTELGSGGTTVYRASIEYPAGVYTQVLFGGSAASGAVADGANVVSDFTTVSIPKDAQFWVRIYCVGVGGIVFNGGLVSGSDNFDVFDSVAGAALEFGVSGITDKTMSGTVANTAVASPFPGYCPAAIVANTVRPSAFLMGDSRNWGAGDTSEATTDWGELAPSIGPMAGYINVGSYGDSAFKASTSYAKRAALAAYCSHRICQYGINDLTGSANRTVAELVASLDILYGLVSGGDIWQATLTPRTTSTDSWATLGNQTVHANESRRVDFNDNKVRSGRSVLLTGYVETADAIESARNSGKIKVTGAAFAYTVDGVHESAAGYQLIKAAGGINAVVVLA